VKNIMESVVILFHDVVGEAIPDVQAITALNHIGLVVDVSLEKVNSKMAWKSLFNHVYFIE